MPSAVLVAFHRRTASHRRERRPLKSAEVLASRRFQAGEVSASSLLAGSSFAGADPPTAFGELAALARDSVPSGLTQAARLFQELVAAVVLARRGSFLLASCAISGIWVDTCNGLLLSGIAPLGALLHEARGTNDLPLMSTWLQIFVVYSLPLGAGVTMLKLLTESILLTLGIDSHLAAAAQTYAYWTMPAVFFEAWYLALKEFHIASSGCQSAGLLVDTAFVFVRWLVMWLFVFKLDAGLKGAGIALLTAHALRLLAYAPIMLLAGHLKHLRLAWRQSLLSSGRWSVLVSVMCPGLVGSVAEKLHLIGCAVLVGRLGATDAASWQLCINVMLLAFVAAFSTGDVVGLRMSSFVAEGKFASARFVSAVGLLSYVVGSLALGTAAFFLVPHFAHLASQDPLVQAKIMQSKYALAVSMPVIGLCVMEAALVAALGRRWIIAVTLPLCCWGLGFTASCWFGLHTPKRAGTPGVVDGLVMGYALAAAGLLVPYIRWLLTRRSGAVSSSPEASMQGIRTPP